MALVSSCYYNKYAFYLVSIIQAVPPPTHTHTILEVTKSMLRSQQMYCPVVVLILIHIFFSANMSSHDCVLYASFQ